MGAFALRVTGASKSYLIEGRLRPVFHSVDLEVAEGEILALLGPSGCGKSTLLRTIAGLEPLSSGRVEISNGGCRRAAVGIVFQDALLLPWLTVAENVALGLQYRANREARMVESVDQVLRDFGIESVASSYPDELSGGQAQRVALARTIVTRPKVLLLDEPFASLDPSTRAALQDWLLDVVQRRHLTVVIVTHDVDEAVYLGDRVALMSPSPGTILRVWETATSRRRDSVRSYTIRAEILAHYRSDIPLVSAASYRSVQE